MSINFLFQDKDYSCYGLLSLDICKYPKIDVIEKVHGLNMILVIEKNYHCIFMCIIIWNMNHI